MNWTKNYEGLEIYYEVKGTGSPIVFQSGYMGIHDIWKYQVEALKENYMCITHDNRGYGLSSKPECSSFYTMEKNADDLKAVLDSAGITEPILLVTHSIGGMIALAFAENYPELIKGILMIGGPALSGSYIKENGGNEQMWSAYQTTPSSSMLFYKNIGLCEEIALEAAKWNHSAFTQQAKAALNYQPSNNLKEILTQPVTVVHSKSDNITPLEAPQQIVDALPNSKMILIDGYKHFPQVEGPNTINKIINDVCKELNY